MGSPMSKKLSIFDAAMEVWRDVILRRCIGRLARNAASGGRADDVATLLENATNMFFELNELEHVVFANISDLEQRLLAEPVVHEPWAARWWTKQSHHGCNTSTRDAIHTLMLVRQRLKANPKAPTATDVPQDSLLQTWTLIASFLER